MTTVREFGFEFYGPPVQLLQYPLTLREQVRRRLRICQNIIVAFL